MKGAIWIVAAILTLVSGIFLVSCAETQTYSEQLQILSHSMTTHEFTGGMPESTAVIKGRAKNVSDSRLDLASIAVNFYDKNGNLIGAASATKQNLDPGEIWDFNVKFAGPDAWKSVDYDIAASAG